MLFLVRLICVVETSALNAIKDISHRISLTVRKRDSALWIIPEPFWVSGNIWHLVVYFLLRLCACNILYISLVLASEWHVLKIDLNIGLCFEKKYWSKEQENVLFCFACRTFFSITLRIIDGGWVCAGDPVKGRGGGEVCEYVHILCVVCVCVCVCACARALLWVSVFLSFSILFHSCTTA
jgi:hypothetical protein